MADLASRVEKIRSKNAGPFWVTIDVFCGTPEAFAWAREALTTDRIAALYRVAPDRIKRFDIESLNAIKVSFPRPVPQGAPQDRDQHGAQYAVLLQELEID